MKALIDKLTKNNNLGRKELIELLLNLDEENKHYLHDQARKTTAKVYSRKIFLRGLIEFTNYCRNDCAYCGLRSSNKRCERYRLSAGEILDITTQGYNLGYRTFVLQGGEDPFFTDKRLTALISKIKARYPDCAVTLSLGERSASSYQKLFEAGASRYLLRHETRSEKLYSKLHPGMSSKAREKCLWDLKKIGFQTGAGFMVGLPSQTTEDYVADLLFLKELEPHMVGIGPFIPHQDTPLSLASSGDPELTCIMLSLARLLLPEVLLPATTALGSVHSRGWEKGLQAGASVLMLNLSPPEIRKKYTLYNGKTSIPDEARIHLQAVQERIKRTGNIADMGRGDHISLSEAFEVSTLV